MTTYICKCGKTFQKNTEAGTTGFRMPDYGPDHECFGCPFVCQVMTWDPVSQQQAVQNHECRGSEKIRYDSTVSYNDTDKTVMTVYTLDFEFLRQVHEFAETLEGFEPDRNFFDNRSTCYDVDGRFRYTLYPTQNQKGIAAKIALKNHFFGKCNIRKDVTPEQEKEIILNRIKEAKAMAQGTQTDPEETIIEYFHHNLVYYVDKRKDNGLFTVFMADWAHPNPETTTECATIPDFPTFEQAQNALDGYAIKRGFTKDPDEQLASEASEPLNDLSSETADAAGEPDTEFAEQQEQEDDSQGSDHAEPDSDNEVDGSDNKTEDSANDLEDSSAPPCDWSNASGSDEDEDEPDNSEDNIPIGERVSLRDDAFSSLMDICDSKINQALRTMFELRQTSFSFTAKITFERRGGAFGIKHETGFNFDPIKVKDKGELYDEIPIQLDYDGNPIIPYDRQHQINFDELQPGREIPPKSVTTTVDASGVVEKVEVDGEDIPNAGEQEDETTEQLPTCDQCDCPFYGFPDDGISGCLFDSEDPNSQNYPGDVWEAVHMHECKREEVLDAYRRNNPEECDSYISDDNMQGNNEEDENND